MDNNWRDKLKSKKGWAALLVFSIIFSIIFFFMMLLFLGMPGSEGAGLWTFLWVLSIIGIISSIANMSRIGKYNDKIEDEYKKSLITNSGLKPETVEVIANECAAKMNGAQQNSSADELIKYKELLDKGIITQEEFDAKKKQFLGLE